MKYNNNHIKTTSLKNGNRIHSFNVSVISPPNRIHLTRSQFKYLQRATKAINICESLQSSFSDLAVITEDRYNRKKFVFRTLEHELSGYACELVEYTQESNEGNLNSFDRLQHEKKAFTLYASSLKSSLNGSDYNVFLEILRNICEVATDKSTSFRKTPVCTSPDRNGTSWRYPDAACIEQELISLWNYLKTESGESLLIKACVAHTVLVLLHPFSDGNGRTARVLFNALLPTKSPGGLYVPCKIIFDMSRQGYNIRLRRVLVHSDWSDMIRFLCNTIVAYYSTLRDMLRTSPSI